MEYKVSVIIPCYNAESTIERAITSVINQTIGFENIELLLYDDASTDNTPNIITEYSKKYSNIIPILSKENSGRPGRGRNFCIKQSSAEFIMFMDNDDEYEENICKTLYNKIKSEDYDLVSCSYINFDGISDPKIKLSYLPEKATKETENEVIFTYPNIFYYENILIWNTIFKKEIILNNNITFPESDFAEDVCFSMTYKLYVKKLCYLKSYFGHLRHVQYDSLSNSFSLDDLNSIHSIHIKLMEKLKKYDLDLAYIFKGHVHVCLTRLYALDLNQPKNEIINFMKRIREFELELNMNYSYDFIINKLNFLIMREKYNIAIIYIKLLNLIYRSKSILKIYRLITRK